MEALVAKKKAVGDDTVAPPKAKQKTETGTASKAKPKKPKKAALAANQVQGTIKQVRYSAPGFSTFSLEPTDTKTFGSQIGVALKSAKAQVTPGSVVTLTGTWSVHPTYGRQFTATKMDVVEAGAPGSLVFASRSACMFVSGKFAGIGEKKAELILQELGLDTFQKIGSTGKHLTIGGLSEDNKAVLSAYKFAHIDAQVLRLTYLGLGIKVAQEAIKTLGPTLDKVLKENPYGLIGVVEGVGFLRADSLALNQGILPSSEFRIRAAISHILREARNKGSCGVPMHELSVAATLLLGISADYLSPVFQKMVATNEMILGSPDDVLCAFHPDIWDAEHSVAEMAKQKRRQAVPPLYTENDIRESELRTGIELNPEQRAAVLNVATSAFSILTGGPGTGKTSTQAILIDVLKAKNVSYELAAPTGKAAKRLGEVTKTQANTLQLMLARKKKADRQGLECQHFASDVLIIDESSMVDILLMFQMFKALRSDTRLLLVGDADQLPPVGAGKPFHDFTVAAVMLVTRLVRLYRNAGNIALSAGDIRNGVVPNTAGEDAIYQHCESQADVRREMEKYIMKLIRLGVDVRKDLMVLSPMRKGEAGTEALNLWMQDTLNPANKDSIEITIEGQRLRVGDRVVQTKNNYDLEVMNGDTGILTDIDNYLNMLTVTFPQGEVYYPVSAAMHLKLAYAITVHKSQGSESPYVAMALCKGHFMLLRRNMVYTGITRAKRSIVLFYEAQSLRMAIGKTDEESRFSMLLSMLGDEVFHKTTSEKFVQQQMTF